jgi:hypothetical protein
MTDRKYTAVKEVYEYGDEVRLPRKAVESEVNYYENKVVVFYLEHDGSSVV